MKCIPYQIASRRMGRVHLDNIEAERNVRVLQEAKPGKRAPNDESAFFFIHGIGRAAIKIRRAGFYLDKTKDPGGFVPCNDVDFSPFFCPVVAIEHPEGVGFQITARDCFAPCAESSWICRGIRIERFVAKQAQSFFDVPGKDHVCGVGSGDMLCRSLCVWQIHIPGIRDPERPFAGPGSLWR